ncbi:hypothetical protein, partial [Parabacteroides goldsteinii]|uniref:hypothetical protein n=1 Tax=Parabacteroides goldsteinii TaxID=328812 RepID=UPI002730B663
MKGESKFIKLHWEIDFSKTRAFRISKSLCCWLFKQFGAVAPKFQEIEYNKEYHSSGRTIFVFGANIYIIFK